MLARLRCGSSAPVGAAMQAYSTCTRLYHALEDASRAQNVQVLYACIAAPVSDGDPHLTRASIDFHTRRGYEIVGTFHRCGYKFDTWYDVVWMEKRLSDAAIPPAVVPFSSFMK